MLSRLLSTGGRNQGHSTERMFLSVPFAANADLSNTLGETTTEQASSFIGKFKKFDTLRVTLIHVLAESKMR